jgi:hypothetical protein
VNLATGSTTTLRRATRGALLTQPSLEGGRLLYVRATQASQQLLLGPALPRASSARDRRLLRARPMTRRDAGHQDGYSTQGRLKEDRHAHPLAPARYELWSTTLTPATAYVTRLRRGGRTADVVRVQL